MSFSPLEIETMLVDYCSYNNLEMNTAILSEKIFYYTSGYPFLVSKICQIIDEQILGVNKTIWALEDIDLAIKDILKGTSTLFDDLIKNIENNKDICSLIERIILLGDEIPFTASNITISKCFIYGIIKDENSECKINNKWYRI